MSLFPVKAILSQRIPKKSLCDHISDPVLRREINDQIARFEQTHSFDPNRINIAKGTRVDLICVFEVELTTFYPDEKMLTAIDRLFPYTALFILKYEDRRRARMSYKETRILGDVEAKVNIVETFQTDWMQEDALPCRIEGFDLDAVRANLIRQIVGGWIAEHSELSIEDAIALDRERRKLQRKIDALEKRIGREKRFDRQCDMLDEKRRLQKDLEKIGRS